MIRYALKCTQGHDFESWFQSAAAYDWLAGAGHVACPMCGDVKVAKSLMAPQVRLARAVEPGDAEPVDADRVPPKAAGPLTSPANKDEAALAALRRHVEENADYVGGTFAAEARRIHAGAAPERPIWGEARIDDAKALIDEGINVAPLPFRPTRKSN